MTSNFALVEWFKQQDIFVGPELAVIDVLQRRSLISDELVLVAAGLAVWAHRNGHPCVYLDALHEQLAEIFPKDDDFSKEDLLPQLDTVLLALQSSPGVVRVVDKDSLGTYLTACADVRPLVLFGNLLFTQRQFADELSIAEQLAIRAARKSSLAVDIAQINRIVPVPLADDVEAQAVGDTGIANRAAQSVVSNCLTVLTGGPGTGKTYTLTRCLAALLSSQEQHLEGLSIALVAPTGKAATRAKELLNNFVSDEQNSVAHSVGVSEKVLHALSRIEPKTIQRVLGSKNRMHTRFEHDHSTNLPHDIIIIDEMSMVASYLMARLLEAVRPEATILLVGDQAQLESVESGSVLRDIVDASLAGQSAVSGRVFELLKVWRQSGETRIGDLARHIRSGEGEKALSLATSNPAGVTFVASKKDGEVSPAIVEATVAELKKAAELAKTIAKENHLAAYQIIAHHKVLCGPRNGPVGVNEWNTHIRDKVHGISDGDLFRPGIPLLVTVNSPRSRLVNGDIGLAVHVQEPDGAVQIKIFFPTDDGGRYLTPAELPQIEICYAMTVHKSQGSEYNNLVVILPNESSPLLTRELVYTAITRAKKSVLIAGTEKAFLNSVQNKSVRYSGLGALLKAL